MKRDQSLIFTTVLEEDCCCSDDSPATAAAAAPSGRNQKNQNRPKFLNLKCKTTDAKAAEPPVKHVSSTPFMGNTSICSTPMADLSKVLHQASMSICVDPGEEKAKAEINESQTTDSVNSLLSAISDVDKEERLDRRVKTENSFPRSKRASSLTGMTIVDAEATDYQAKGRSRRTIADPTFPFFTTDGRPISEHLYKNSICNGDMLELKRKDFEDSGEVWSSLKDFDYTNSDVDLRQSESSYHCEKAAPPDRGSEPRKSLSLPLKSLSKDAVSQGFHLNRNGVQLTPLLSKLSILGVDEKSSGFCSTDVSPTEYKDTAKYPRRSSYPFSNKGKNENLIKEEERKLQSVVLFVCGQQDMVMNLLLEENVVNSLETITTLVSTVGTLYIHIYVIIYIQFSVADQEGPWLLLLGFLPIWMRPICVKM